MGNGEAQQATDRCAGDRTLREQESLRVTVPIVHSAEGWPGPDCDGQDAAKNSPSYTADECTTPFAGLPDPNRVNFT